MIIDSTGPNEVVQSEICCGERCPRGVGSGLPLDDHHVKLSSEIQNRFSHLVVSIVSLLLISFYETFFFNSEICTLARSKDQ